MLIWKDKLDGAPDFHIGTTVYIQWAEDEPPRKRVVIGLAKLMPRNANMAAIYRLDPQVDVKDVLIYLIQTPNLIPACHQVEQDSRRSATRHVEQVDLQAAKPTFPRSQPLPCL